LSSLSVENQRKLDVLQQSLDDLTVTLYRHFNLTPPARTTQPAAPGGFQSGSGVGEIVVSPPSTTPGVSVVPPSAPSSGGDSRAAFDAGLRSYNTENYAEALTLFDEYQRNFPNGAEAAEVQYYRAQCHFRMGDYQRAIQEYERVWLNYPNSATVSTAMHNAAVSYSRLGENARAIEMFQRLIREYPDEAAAESARNKLRQLQGLN